MPCPHCGVQNDSVASIDGGVVPKHDSFSLCASCLGLAMFVSTPVGLAVRLLTPSEAEQAEADHSLIAVRAKVLALKATGQW